MLNWKNIFVGLLVVAGFGTALAVVGIIVERAEQADIQKAKSQATQIIQAIDQFHMETGRYPESLEHLIPKYSAPFAAPAWGDGVWRYMLDPKGNGYHLYVRTEGRHAETLYYESAAQVWRFDR
ncbi:MAG: type II secretion system protein GspG [Tepidisphaeraceae bacterium]